jgi:hypothetical protein
MTRAAHAEIQRLRQLHQGSELQLEFISTRSSPSPRQLNEIRELEERKLQLENRIAWFESILREHANPGE